MAGYTMISCPETPGLEEGAKAVPGIYSPSPTPIQRR